MIKNIFITGKAGCGKTTLIMEIIKELNLNGGGFYTSEIREKGVRKGFKITTLNGEEGILAHVNVKSPHRVGKYRVNIKDLEGAGVKSILDSLREKKITVVNELGKMELFSEKFKEAVLTALDSKNKILGTIKMRPDPFTDRIKKRKDTKVFHLKRENFGVIKNKIKEIIKNGNQK